MRLCTFLLLGILNVVFAMQAPLASKGKWIVELSSSWNVSNSFTKQPLTMRLLTQGVGPIPYPCQRAAVSVPLIPSEL